MIKTIADIITAVNGCLNTGFPNIPRYSTDKDKKLTAPCFITRYTASTDGSEEFRHDFGTIRVYYFPDDKDINRIDLLTKQESLTNIFRKGINTSDLFIPINDLTFETEDDVLIMSFSYDLYQYIDAESTLPNIEQLDLV